MPLFWCQCHMMSTVSSMVPFHLLVKDDHNEMQHDFSRYVMPLAPVLTSYEANGIVNGTIPLFISRQ